MLSGRAVAEHLEEQTRGKKDVGASEIIRLAEEVDAGSCFMGAFDARTFALSGEKNRGRQKSRPRHVLLAETDDAVR